MGVEVHPRRLTAADIIPLKVLDARCGFDRPFRKIICELLAEAVPTEPLLVDIEDRKASRGL